MKTQLALLVVLLSAALARADAAFEIRHPTAKMSVVVDANAKSPRVVIPRRVVQTDRRRGSADSLRTLMAGAGLALAFAGGGVWVIRQRPGSKTVALLACGALLTLGMVASAEIPRLTSIASFGKAQVVIDDRDIPMEIMLSPEDLAKLRQAAK